MSTVRRHPSVLFAYVWLCKPELFSLDSSGHSIDMSECLSHGQSGKHRQTVHLTISFPRTKKVILLKWFRLIFPLQPFLTSRQLSLAPQYKLFTVQLSTAQLHCTLSPYSSTYSLSPHLIWRTIWLDLFKPALILKSNVLIFSWFMF